MLNTDKWIDKYLVGGRVDEDSTSSDDDAQVRRRGTFERKLTEGPFFCSTS